MKALIFTYGLTYGGALLSLVNPFYGLLVYVCFALLKPDSFWSWSVPEGNYSRIVALGLLAGWAIHGFGNWNFGRARGIFIALVGFLGWMVLASLNAADRGLAFSDVEAMAKIVLPVVIGMTLIERRKQVMQLAWVMLLTVGYMSVEWNLSYKSGNSLVLREISFGGLDNNGVAIVLNSFVGLAVFFALRPMEPWKRVMCLGLGLSLIHAIMLTNSRGGMLALACSGLAFYVIMPKGLNQTVLFGLVVLFSLMLAGTQVRERFGTLFSSEGKEDGSLRDRKHLISIAVNSIQHRPILGVGPRNWTRVAKHEYQITRATEVHNTWGQVAAEMGLPGLVLLVAFYAICLARLWPIARGRAEEVDPDERCIAGAVSVSLIGGLIAMTFVTLYRCEAPYYLVLAGAGLIMLRKDLERTSTDVIIGVDALDDPGLHSGAPAALIFA